VLLGVGMIGGVYIAVKSLVSVLLVWPGRVGFAVPLSSSARGSAVMLFVRVNQVLVRLWALPFAFV